MVATLGEHKVLDDSECFASTSEQIDRAALLIECLLNDEMRSSRVSQQTQGSVSWAYPPNTAPFSSCFIQMVIASGCDDHLSYVVTAEHS